MDLGLPTLSSRSHYWRKVITSPQLPEYGSGCAMVY
jgi:hypothetical protein